MIRRWARYAIALLEGLRDELEAANDRFVCSRVGHDPSWTYAASIGVLDGPVCQRCDEPLGQ